MTDMISGDSLNSFVLRRVRRAIGAMFFFGFGGAWLGLWAYQVFGGNPVILAIVLIATLFLTGLAYGRVRANRAALAEDSASPARKKIDRIFHMVNGGQWILIVVLGNILANIGHSNWIIPMAIFVIGLHFLPLAHLFANRPHYVTGAALMLLAAIYPWMANDGPANPIGCLGAGCILWVSAMWAIMVAPSAITKMARVET